MQNPRTVFILLFFFFSSTVFSQKDAVILNYIDTYKEIAIAEMQRTGVPASIKLAQGIHETGAGESILVKKSNNHFGIKCKAEWKGESVKHTDDAPNECFRKYESPLESYVDHSDFLKNGTRYASLFRLDPTDYEGWAKGLKKAGYATNPKYPQVIIGLIEKYGLQDYTLIALGKKQAAEVFVKNEKTLSDDEIKFINKAEEKKQAVMTPVTNNEPVIVKKSVYPTSEFRINDTRVVWISKGTSFLSIADKYNVGLKRIFEFNDQQQTEFAEKDQLVYLQRKRKTGNEELHTVKEGESLHDIAQLQAIRMESLLEYNHLAPGMKPKPGAKLYLRSTAPVKPELASGN